MLAVSWHSSDPQHLVQDLSCLVFTVCVHSSLQLSSCTVLQTDTGQLHSHFLHWHSHTSVLAKGSSPLFSTKLLGCKRNLQQQHSGNQCKTYHQLPHAAHVSLNIYCTCLALMRICNLSVASVYLGGRA